MFDDKIPTSVVVLLFFCIFVVLEQGLISSSRPSKATFSKEIITDALISTEVQLSITLDVASRTIIPAWVKNFFLRPTCDSENAKLDSSFESQKRAQFGEDAFAYYNFFFRVENGLILESGALDGVLVSTTKPFVNALGWHAVHIEPQPVSFSKLQDNRPDGLNVHAALCNLPTPLHYATGNPWWEVGGIWEFMTEQHRTQFFPDMTDADIESLPLISCSLLAPLLAYFNISHVNFWVLDTEGSELSILQTVDFSKLHVDVIAIEITGGANNERGLAIRNLLISEGFCYYGYDSQDQKQMNIWFVHHLYIPHSRPGNNLKPIDCPGDIKKMV